MDDTNLLDIIKKIRTDSEDILGVIDFGIIPIINKTKEDEYEISTEKLNEMISELFIIKERLNKNFISLKHKV